MLAVSIASKWVGFLGQDLLFCWLRESSCSWTACIGLALTVRSLHWSQCPSYTPDNGHIYTHKQALTHPAPTNTLFALWLRSIQWGHLGAWYSKSACLGLEPPLLFSGQLCAITRIDKNSLCEHNALVAKSELYIISSLISQNRDNYDLNTLDIFCIHIYIATCLFSPHPAYWFLNWKVDLGHLFEGVGCGILEFGHFVWGWRYLAILKILK